MEADISDLPGIGRERRHPETRIGEIGRERAASAASVAGATLRRVSWGAILALMIQFMLGLFGLGLGLSSPLRTDAGIFSVGGLWAVIVVLVGVFAGAFAAGRFAGIPSRIDGALHGVVTWAVTALLSLYLLTAGAASLVGGAFGVLGQSVDAMARAAETLAPGAAPVVPGLADGAQQLFAAAPAQPVTGGTDDVASGDGAPQAQPATQADRDAAYAQVTEALAAADDQARGQAVDSVARVAGVARPEAERRVNAFAERFAAARADMERARSAAAGRRRMKASAFSPAPLRGPRSPPSSQCFSAWRSARSAAFSGAPTASPRAGLRVTER